MNLPEQIPAEHVLPISAAPASEEPGRPPGPMDCGGGAVAVRSLTNTPPGQRQLWVQWMILATVCSCLSVAIWEARK